MILRPVMTGIGGKMLGCLLYGGKDLTRIVARDESIVPEAGPCGLSREECAA